MRNGSAIQSQTEQLNLNLLPRSSHFVTIWPNIGPPMDSSEVVNEFEREREKKVCQSIRTLFTVHKPIPAVVVAPPGVDKLIKVQNRARFSFHSHGSRHSLGVGVEIGW